MTADEYRDTAWGPDLEAEEGFEEATASNVPRDTAEKLLWQGCSDQWYDDGYDAASAAAPYLD
jgi:hypothetical protein